MPPNCQGSIPISILHETPGYGAILQVQQELEIEHRQLEIELNRRRVERHRYDDFKYNLLSTIAAVSFYIVILIRDRK